MRRGGRFRTHEVKSVFLNWVILSLSYVAEGENNTEGIQNVYIHTIPVEDLDKHT